jgi:23S rRNA (cytosine1962-C5)-methyltransferase
MAKLKIKLARNLRRSVMRGHPWVYKDALMPVGKVAEAQLCQVQDTKGELAWAIYDPHGPLSLRILSTDKTPPTQSTFEKRLALAYNLRESIRSKETNAYRLINGEGDLLPGMVCDIYDTTAVLQFDGQGPSEFWDKNFVADWLLNNTEAASVIEKTRRNTEKTVDQIAGVEFANEVVIRENGAVFKVNLEKGQKTGFFLDQRDNRNYIRQVARNKSVLNLFSYTGGFSIYAGLGLADKVASLDVSKGAIATAEENWALNGLKPSSHFGYAVDVFDYLNGEKEMWDHILVDPPSMSHSEAQKITAMTKYEEIFSAAAKRVNVQGQLSLSSCSSHISFEDFFTIIDESLSSARRRGRILRVSGQGIDHPFPHACHELRYLKFVHLALD